MLTDKYLRMRVSNVNSHSLTIIKMEELVEMLNNSTDVDEQLAILKHIISIVYDKTLYDEQLMTVISMLEGDLVQVKTGEGKSLCVICYAILMALSGNKVYVATTNTYLSLRDYEEFEKLFQLLGITVMYNIPFTEYPNPEAKEEIYNCSVIFTDCCELVFDYLRDRIHNTKLVSLDTVVLDEIDFVLIDNASTTCNLVDGEADIDMHYIFYMQLFSSLFDDLSYTKVAHDERLSYNLWNVDFVGVESSKSVIVTDEGLSHIENLLGSNIFEDGHLAYLLEIIIVAYFMYEINEDYTILDGKCTVINKNNGRSSKGTAFEIDIQNALELKHNLDFTRPPNKSEVISYQVFYSKFKNLVGLSGTLVDAESEFKEIFKKSIYTMPTHREVIRKDVTTRYFKTMQDKLEHLKSLIKTLKDIHPLLVVTDTDSSAIHLHESLLVEFPEARLLTNLNLEDETSILANSGTQGSLVVSTPIVGRGTDIKLDDVCKSTGLAVIMLCHFDNSRIDTQVKGRSGRQGEPGVTYTLSSLEDSIWAGLGQDKLELLREMKNSSFYTVECQRYLDTEREKLQRLLTSGLETSRKMQFVKSMVTEEFIDKLVKLRDEGLVRSEIVTILNYDYESKYQLEDTEEMQELAIYAKYPEDVSLLEGDLNWIPVSEYFDYFEEFISVLRTYVDESRIGEISQYVVETHTYAQNYYMHTLKKFIIKYLISKEV